MTLEMVSYSKDIFYSRYPSNLKSPFMTKTARFGHLYPELIFMIVRTLRDSLSPCHYQSLLYKLHLLNKHWNKYLIRLLYETPFLCSRNLNSFIHSIQGSHWSMNVKTLDISHFKLQNVNVIAKAFPCLNGIHFSMCDLELHDLQEFLLNSKHSLESLEFTGSIKVYDVLDSSNVVHDEIKSLSMHHLSKIILNLSVHCVVESNLSDIIYTSVGSNLRHFKGLNGDFIKIFTKTNVLESLYLDWLVLTQDHLIQTALHCPKLKRLSLKGSNLHSEHACLTQNSLLALESYCPQLTQLDISYSNAGDEGLYYLPSTLSHLIMSGYLDNLL